MQQFNSTKIDEERILGDQDNDGHLKQEESIVRSHFMRGCVPEDLAYFKTREIQDKF
jgi:hypothetical protein